MPKKKPKPKTVKKKAATKKKSTKAPGRSRIKATPGGETFYIVRRKDGTFKDWVKINRSIAQDALRKAKNVPSRKGRGHQGDYPKRKKPKTKKTKKKPTKTRKKK